MIGVILSLMFLCKETLMKAKELKSLRKNKCNLIKFCYLLNFLKTKFLIFSIRELHNSFKKDITRGGNKIHSLINSTLTAVGISEASPGWQEYLIYMNEIIFGGFRISSLSSLKNMLNSMTDSQVFFYFLF